MTYPGSPELSAQAQERVMTTFRQIVSKIQDGLLEEAKVGLDFVLRLDPTFSPGLELQRQLAAGRASIDLMALISHLDAPSSDTINILLVEAVEAFNQRNYLEAKEMVKKVLLDLPGHGEARNLLEQVNEALKVENQVGQFLTQAREAMDRGDPEEAANFVMMAQALDPHHRGIQGMLVKLQSPDVAQKSPAQTPQEPADQPAPTQQPVAPAPASPEHPRVAVPPEAPQAPGGQAPPAAPAQSGEHSDGQDSWDIASAFSDQESAADGPQASASETPPAPDSDIHDLFVIDSSDDIEPPAHGASLDPPPPAPPEPAAGPAPPQPQHGTPLERSGPEFDDSSGDLGDLFQSDPDMGDQFALDAEDSPSFDPVDDRATQIQALVDQAKAAWANGDGSTARDLIEGILSTDPGHNEALDLIEQIDKAEEPPEPEPVLEASPVPDELPPPPPKDDADPEFFAHDFAPPDQVSTAPFDDASEAGPRPETESRPGSGSRSPLRLALMVGAGVVIVLATMWLGRGFFSDRQDAEEERAQAVTRVLQEAETFFNQGKTEEALHLLQSFPAEGIEKQRIDKRIARYEANLAPPPPTPIPEAFTEGRALLDQGQWLESFMRVHAGLQDSPDDPGLRALYEEIAAIQPEIVPLFASLNNQDFATAASIARDLEQQHRDQTRFSDLHERCLFNAALSDLRSYNLVGARNYLESLKRRKPQDAEVERILEFISTYSNRSVDMQLEIFVGSLEAR